MLNTPKQALQSNFIDGYIAKKKDNQAPRARAALRTTHNMQSKIAARSISLFGRDDVNGNKLGLPVG